MSEKRQVTLGPEKLEDLPKSTRARGVHVKPAILLLALLCWYWWFSALLRRPNLERNEDTFHRGATFDWSTIDPSPTLQYQPCYGNFYCARLEVPLDWNSTATSGASKAALAIVRSPAPVDVTDPRYGGSILFNNGGPGGSAVSFLLDRAASFRTIIDSEVPLLKGDYADRNEVRAGAQAKYFDLIAWDPRGVNNTTPNHPGISNPLARKNWNDQGSAIGLDFDNEAVFDKILARETVWAELISSANSSVQGLNEGEHVGQFVSTANVVRDMVEIVERLGEWRQKEAKKLLSASYCSNQHKRDVINRTAWRMGEEQIQYWGFSYGTVIGQTFATMQPHRVKRLVLDGVVNVMDYYDNKWEQNLWDVDHITANFTTACFSAGPSHCALFDPTGPAAINATFHDILTNLTHHPLTGFNPDSTPIVVSHTDVINRILDLWYTPYANFRVVASFMFDLKSGNISAFYSTPLSCDSSPLSNIDSYAAAAGISCTDGGNFIHDTKDEYLTYLDFLRSQSPLFANRWARIRMFCHGYSIHAKWRFAGPFGAQTAHPILFASQTLDPVTPLRNAIDAAKLFPGAGIVEAHGLGHCTISYPSLCAMKVIRQYFQSGEVPDGKKFCESSVRPFGEEGLSQVELMEERNWKLLDAAKKIAASPVHDM